MTQAEYNKRERENRKREHLCIQCGKQDAYTLNGRSRCAVCAENARNSDKRRNKTKRNDAHRKRMERWIAEGKCSRCGREKIPGYSLCKRCIISMNAKKRAKKIEDGMNWPRGSNGICWTCNKNKVIPGRKLCEECYRKTLDAQKKADEWHKINGYGFVALEVENFWEIQRANGWLSPKSG